MENNEIMNYNDIEVVEDAVVTEKRSGMSTGAAVCIGAGVAIAVSAVAKWVKKAWAKHKAKQEQNDSDCDVYAEEEDMVDESK